MTVAVTDGALPIIGGLSAGEHAEIQHLRMQLLTDSALLQELDCYYEGEQRFANLGVAIPPELDVLLTVINWPRVTVDSVVERLFVEGFRMPGTDGGDARLYDWWQFNGMDEESQLAHLEALALGRAYITVGSPDAPGEPPRYAVESAMQMWADVDPRTKRVRSALKLWFPHEPESEERATLYLPGSTIYLVNSGGWEVYDRDDHRMPFAPVVPMVNRDRIYRPRLPRRYGCSEMADVIPLTDAAVRTMTNLQAAAELLAVPQRWALGMSKEDFVDADGNPKAAWEAYIGRIWTNEGAPSDVQFGQFAAADLTNFTSVLGQYSKLVSSVTGLPPDYLGFAADNPASAEAINASADRLVRRASAKHLPFGGAWEQAQRIGMFIVDGDVPAEAHRMAALWRDPATPTLAAKADAVTKLVSAGIYPASYAPYALGLPQSEIDRIEALRARDGGAEALAQIVQRAGQVGSGGQGG